MQCASSCMETQSKYSMTKSVNDSPPTMCNTLLCSIYSAIGRPSLWGAPGMDTSLKGVCYGIFELHFFHDLNPSRPLINMLKYFRIQFRFRWYIRILSKLRGVHHTAESSTSVCIISLSQAPRCTSHHRVKWFLTNSAVCIPPRSRALRCALYLGVWLHGVMHIAPCTYLTKCLFWSEVLQMLFLCDAWRY